MKVLVVTHTADLSGANKSLLGIIEELRNKVEFIVLVNNKEGELIKCLNEMNIKMMYSKYSWWCVPPRSNTIKKWVKFIIEAIRYFRYRNISNRIYKEIMEEQFDCVYTNTSTIDYGAIIAEKINVPHIWHIREFGKEDFGFIPFVSKKYMRSQFEKAKNIILVSNALMEKYKDSLSSSKLKVVYNGFSINELKSLPREHYFNKQINILISGQVCESKGQAQAIAATEILVQKGMPIRLYIAGEFDELYLNNELSKYKNHEWIEILGHVKDMYKLRNKMDIELVCSRNEAFGRVTLEAMLHAIPVIASNKGGTLELIKNEETGILYEYNQVSELADKISRLVSNKQLYEEIVKNAQKFAEDFTVQKTANEVLKILMDSVGVS